MVISAATLLWTLSALMFAALPIYFGAAADTHGLSAREIGFLGSSYLLGFVFASAVAVAWLPRVDWRAATSFATLLAIASCLVSLGVTSYVFLFTLLLLFGYGNGSVAAIAFRILGAASQPERIFGLANTVQIILQAGLVFLFTALVIPAFGFFGLTIAIALALALIFGCIAWMPRRSEGMGIVQSHSAEGALTPLIILSHLALTALYVGVTSMWVFTERMGADTGFQPEAIGRVIALAILAVGAGSLVAAVQALRWGRLWPLAGGCAVMAFAFFALTEAETFGRYTAAVLAYNFCWGYVLTFVFGLMAAADPAGRFVGALGASFGIGAAIGPGLAGTIILGADYGPLAVLASVAVASCFVLGVAVIALLHKAGEKGNWT